MAKRDEKKKEEGGATASASEETTKRGAKDVVKEIEHAAQDIAEKVTHGAENLVSRVDTALHYGRDKAKETADVNGDGVVDSKDVTAGGGEVCDEVFDDVMTRGGARSRAPKSRTMRKKR